MSRSHYKIPYINREVILKSFQDQKNKKNTVTFYKKNSAIPFIFINKTLLIYKGSDFKSYNYYKEHLGLKLGEFALTRKQVKHTGKKKKISKKRIKIKKSFFIYDLKSKFFTT